MVFKSQTQGLMEMIVHGVTAFAIFFSVVAAASVYACDQICTIFGGSYLLFIIGVAWLTFSSMNNRYAERDIDRAINLFLKQNFDWITKKSTQASRKLERHLQVREVADLNHRHVLKDNKWFSNTLKKSLGYYIGILTFVRLLFWLAGWG